MHTKTPVLVFSFLMISSFAYGAWLDNYPMNLHEEFKCKETDPVHDRSPCNYLVKNALKNGWGITDFDKPDRESASGMYDYMQSASQWVKIGTADSQQVLNLAQELANQKKPVVAASKGNPHGHVVLIIPGPMSQSGSWGLKVPNSASFRIDKPDKAYVGKGLSHAWSSGSKSSVALFYRK